MLQIINLCTAANTDLLCFEKIPLLPLFSTYHIRRHTFRLLQQFLYLRWIAESGSPGFVNNICLYVRVVEYSSSYGLTLRGGSIFSSWSDCSFIALTIAARGPKRDILFSEFSFDQCKLGSLLCNRKKSSLCVPELWFGLNKENLPSDIFVPKKAIAFFSSSVVRTSLIVPRHLFFKGLQCSLFVLKKVSSARYRSAM
jgi:hypothetical protein